MKRNRTAIETCAVNYHHCAATPRAQPGQTWPRDEAGAQTLLFRFTLTILFSVCLWAVPATWAGPFARNLHFTQPDGTQLTLRGAGDDFHAEIETATGYAVIFDPQQRAYFYADRAADGKNLVSTGVLAHKPPPLGLPQHIRMDADAIAAHARARQEQWDADTSLSKRWGQLKSLTLGSRPAQAAGASPAPPPLPTVGTKLGLTLLIDFSDAPATIARAEIEAFCNGDSYSGFDNNGSVKKYYSDVSAAHLTYSNVVTIYVRMIHPKSFYNNTAKDCGTQGRLLVNDAIDILKARSDYSTVILPTFNDLTTDGSGRVLAFNVLFAGEDSGVWSYGLWPHSWVLASPLSLGNGKSVYAYEITDIGASLELGTFCHESGHMLCGFPDIYDYDYDSVGGAGVFCLMAYGGSGTNPHQVCAYLKLAAGWATVTDLNSSSSLTGTLVAAPNPGYDNFYRFRRPGVSTEYFLLENRQPTGRDLSLPSAGIAVWHIDELGDRDDQSLTPNSSHANYELTLVQADNQWHFENKVNYGDFADLYYEGNSAADYANRLSDWSSPNAHWWDGTASRMDVNSFSGSGMTMTFLVEPGGSGLPAPVLSSEPPVTPATQNTIYWSAVAATSAPLLVQQTAPSAATLAGDVVVSAPTHIPSPARTEAARAQMQLDLQEGPSAPDLTPYRPGNWDDKIPVGIAQLNLADPHAYSGPFYDDQTLYFNWASANQGTAAAGSYTVHFEVTGTGGGTWDWTISSHALNQWWGLGSDQPVGPLSAGVHTLRIWLDYNGTVFESNESNNYYERSITVETVSPVEYYAECADNANFTSPVNSGWVQQLEYTFSNLTPGQTYWYRVKARHGAEESGWSNVEQSQQEPLPGIEVTPASQDFGTIRVGLITDGTFTVQNTGGGTLSGIASVPSPFAIVSGSPYSLGAGETRVVTVRYSPTAAATDSADVTFTGGGGAVRPVTGSATNPPPLAGFTASPTTGVWPLTVAFANQTSGATAYIWDFGDGETSTAQDPVHVYYHAGIYTVSLTATGPGGSDTISRNAYITVEKAAATVTLADLSQIYDGTPRNATATSSPAGLAIILTYDGTTEAPIAAGSYEVVGTITDADYAGAAAGTLAVAKAEAAVLLGNLKQTFDGTPKSVSVATTPPGLLVTLTYDGSPDPPVSVGSYTVAGTVTDLNYQGSATATLVVQPPFQDVVFENVETYSGYVLEWSEEAGDEITLASDRPERYLTEVDIGAYSSADVAGLRTAQLRLYKNDGLLGLPGTLIYASNPVELPRANDLDVRFLLDCVPVPDSFTWTIAFSGTPSDPPRLRLYDPPTVGYSSPDFWYQSGGAWVKGNFGSSLPANFRSRFLACASPGLPIMTGTAINVTARPGLNVTLSECASGTLPIGYQWLQNGLVLDDRSSVTGTHTAEISLTGVQASEAGLYALVATNAVGGRTNTVAGLTVLPAPWWDQDIGDRGVPGWASSESSHFVVAGSGADIWGAYDGCHFVYVPLAGDGAITAQVLSLGDTDPWAKAGVMIRENLNPGSKHALMAMTPGNGTAFQRRTSTEGPSYQTAGATVTAPYWVKLVRNGSTLTGYTSPEGLNWTSIGSDTIGMSDYVYAGLAVSAHQFDLLNLAVFDPVQVEMSGIDLRDPAQALADTDGDGLSNLMEYGLGTDLRDSTDAQNGMVVFLADNAGSKYLSLTFNRRKIASGMEYIPEFSNDMQTWYSDTAHVQQVNVAPLDEQFERVTMQDSTAILPPDPRFVRLRLVWAGIETTSETWIGAGTTLQGNGGSGTKLTLFSQRMVLPVEYAGTIAQLQDAILTDTNATWTDRQFGSNGTPAYVEFDNGSLVTIADTTASSQSLFLNGSVSAIANVGDQYRVRRHFTIANLFGAKNETGVNAGLNPTAADNILLQIPETQQVITIFYASSISISGWRRADYTPATNQIICPEQGVMFQRKAPGDVILYAAGVVKAGQTAVPIQGGYNLVGTLRSLASVKVSDLNLYTGDPATGIAPGLNPTTADNLLFVESSGAVTTLFYYEPGNGNGGWRTATYAPAGGRVVEAGRPFFIHRKPPHGLFYWAIPAQ